MMRPAVNRPIVLLLFFFGFTGQTKNHTAIYWIGVYNIMLFTDGCAVLGELEQDTQLQK